MFETVKLIGILCVCIIGIFCAVTLLLTTEHKKSSLPFLSVLSYVLFLVLFLFLGGYTFLNTFRDEMLLMQIGIKIGSTTGYTDEMMEIVVPAAKANGYDPDCWYSPNSVNNMGRPYPYMIYKNMQKLGVHAAANVIKVGDTVADIKEGIAAGAITVGVVEGSSVMGLSEAEYEKLSVEEKTEQRNRVKKVYEKAGADYVIQNMSELTALVHFMNA